MNIEAQMNTVIQTLDCSATERKKIHPAVYCLTLITLASIGLTANVWFQRLDFAPLKAIAQQQSVELKERTLQINRLTEANVMLSRQTQQLAAELDAARKADDAEAATNESKDQLPAVSPAAEDLEDGLCEIIIQNIKMVENQLNRDDFFRLRDARESDAVTVLEKYQTQLSECRTNVKNSQTKSPEFHHSPSVESIIQAGGELP